ncbi:head decoration protein [Alteromonas pelagimontana]|uniref:Head decoration protein n=1 Tax=Alteromonas pelagimontana TaxID=1858656 RepID=A0A6M4M8S8_9ALTE|nr:head decoration protein [Alteromonas pelagimontana]QJR79611.1 head decoration protein [Alteromonas pelagimontana]
MFTETYDYEDVTSGSDQIATTSVTIASGQNLAAFTPIGQVTSSGKYVETDTAATNGSQKAVYITPQAIDASAGDVTCQVFKAGTFDPSMLAWHASFTDTTKSLAFVGTPISLQTKAAKL